MVVVLVLTVIVGMVLLVIFSVKITLSDFRSHHTNQSTRIGDGGGLGVADGDSGSGDGCQWRSLFWLPNNSEQACQTTLLLANPLMLIWFLLVGGKRHQWRRSWSIFFKLPNDSHTTQPIYVVATKVTRCLCTGMQQAPNMASVLFFPTAVLIFGLYTRKICLVWAYSRSCGLYN